MQQEGMEKLKSYISSQPAASMGKVAKQIGVSRPYLYDLLGGTRHPSFAVAKRIEEATGGKVPIGSWENFAMIAAAVNHEGQGAA